MDCEHEDIATSQQQNSSMFEMKCLTLHSLLQRDVDVKQSYNRDYDDATTARAHRRREREREREMRQQQQQQQQQGDQYTERTVMVLCVMLTAEHAVLHIA